jgi:hypothetical protein
MAEVLIDFDIQLRGPDKRLYGAQACGRERPDGMWEGWIEFDPVEGGKAVRTSRETTQPRRDHLMYWATGLTASYLDGALLRTIGPLPSLRPRDNPRARPYFDGPAELSHADSRAEPAAVLNPFRVYASGAGVLQGQLQALGKDHLGNIVKAYQLTSQPAAAVDAMSREELIELITRAVVKQ